MAQNSEINKYKITTKTGEVIDLSKEKVEKYITDNVAISAPEYNFFFQLCKTYGLNPFLKECYCIKYGSSPATIVVDYKVLQQIAESNGAYNGMEHGVIIANEKGEIEERLGDYKLPNEKLIAGWCKVYRKDRDIPTKVVAMFDEFKGKKSSGELNSNWSTKPCFMIVKVAKAQALREAFPNSFSANLYSTEEAENIKPQKEQPSSPNVVQNEIDFSSTAE